MLYCTVVGRNNCDQCQKKHHFRLSVVVALSSKHFVWTRHGRKPPFCCWNFDAIYRSSRDISTSGLGGHIAISGCRSLSQWLWNTFFDVDVIGTLDFVTWVTTILIPDLFCHSSQHNHKILVYRLTTWLLHFLPTPYTEKSPKDKAQRWTEFFCWFKNWAGGFFTPKRNRWVKGRGFTQGCAILGSRWWTVTFMGPKSPETPHFGGLNRHFKPNMRKIQIAVSSDLCIRLTWNLTGSCGQQQTSWVVSYGGKTIPRWLTPAILKIVISTLSDLRIIRFWWNFVHSSRFWTAWTSRYQKRKSCTGQTTSSTERISCFPELLSVSVRPYNPVHSVFLYLLCIWFCFFFQHVWE